MGKTSVDRWDEQLRIDSGAMNWCRLCFSCCSCWEGGREQKHSCLCIIKTEKRREEGFFQGSCLREEKNGAPVQLLLFSRLCSCTLPLRCVALLAVEATLDVIDEGVDNKLSDYVLVSIYVFMWENKKSCVEWPAGSKNGFKKGLELGVGEFQCQDFNPNLTKA